MKSCHPSFRTNDDLQDLGEFGIAPQRLRTKRDFMETLGLPGGREQLAWERAPAAKADDLVSRIADIVKPVVKYRYSFTGVY